MERTAEAANSDGREEPCGPGPGGAGRPRQRRAGNPAASPARGEGCVRVPGPAGAAACLDQALFTESCGDGTWQKLHVSQWARSLGF